MIRGYIPIAWRFEEDLIKRDGKKLAEVGLFQLSGNARGTEPFSEAAESKVHVRVFATRKRGKKSFLTSKGLLMLLSLAELTCWSNLQRRRCDRVNVYACIYGLKLETSH